MIHPEVKNWIKYAKFEEKNNYVNSARRIYERGIEFFGEENMDEKLLIAFAKYEEAQKEVCVALNYSLKSNIVITGSPWGQEIRKSRRILPYISRPGNRQEFSSKVESVGKYTIGKFSSQKDLKLKTFFMSGDTVCLLSFSFSSRDCCHFGFSVSFFSWLLPLLV